MTRCAVLGLGAMGSRIAARLLIAGHQVTVWNRSSAPAEKLGSAGARIARTPREAAEHGEVVISMVTDDRASRAIWMEERTGALGGLSEAAVAVEQSTVTPAWAIELAELARGRGARCIDAPVVGSRPQADAGHLVHLVGGPTEIFARVAPVLSAMGCAAHHMGPNGAGATMKLVVNAFFGIQVAALGELVGVARRSRLDNGRMLDVLCELAVTSPALRGAIGLITAQDFAPLFPLALVKKDFQYAVSQAESVGASAPLTRRTQDLLSQACAQGLGAENITALTKLFE